MTNVQAMADLDIDLMTDQDWVTLSFNIFAHALSTSCCPVTWEECLTDEGIVFFVSDACHDPDAMVFTWRQDGGWTLQMAPFQPITRHSSLLRAMKAAKTARRTPEGAHRRVRESQYA